jgi:hypothetical protein
VLRAGAYGTDLSISEKRHFTAGIGLRPRPGIELSYAYDSYELDNQSIRRSFVSLKYPFDTSVEEPTPR